MNTPLLAEHFSLRMRHCGSSRCDVIVVERERLPPPPSTLFKGEDRHPFSPLLHEKYCACIIKKNDYEKNIHQVRLLKFSHHFHSFGTKRKRNIARPRGTRKVLKAHLLPLSNSVHKIFPSNRSRGSSPLKFIFRTKLNILTSKTNPSFSNIQIRARVLI